MRKLLITSVVVAAALTTAANAAVVGNFSQVATGTATATGPVDVYHFTITTTGGEGAIQGFDFTSATGGGFSGIFVNGTQTFSTSSDLPDVGVILADTFFVSPIAGPSAVQTLDDGSVLESSYAFAASPIDASGGVVAAVFSVAPGGDAPVFNGGNVVIGGEVVSIVPEPGSLALLGLGGLALLRRRR